MSGALDGIRVLDFTQFQQGTYATALLADLGADVLKVEQPGGDPGRRFFPRADGYSPYFECLNRNKRSIVVNLRRPEGLAAIYRLAARSDIAVENLRPGALDRLGAGYEDLRRHNPRLIYASASTFGPRGPRAGDPGYDNVAQAVGGIMMATRHDESAPYAPQPGLADQVGGMILSHAILAALLARERTGTGQKVEASLYGSQIAMQAIHLSDALHHTPRPSAGRGAGGFSHRSFCADAVWISFGYLTGEHWPNLCRALDLEWLQHDPRFAELPERVKNQHELVEIVDAQVALRRSEEWLRRLIDAGVPCAPVQDYRMIGADPQALANDYVVSYRHPHYGEVRVNGFSAALSETPPSVRHPAPMLPGLQSEQILRENGFAPDEIASLLACGAIVQADAG